MKEELEGKFKFISFLNEQSLSILNEIAKKARIKYVRKHTKKPIEEKINYDKLMRQGSKNRI